MKTSMVRITNIFGKEFLGVRINDVFFLDQDGREWKQNQIKSTSFVRGLQPEVKEAFNKMATCFLMRVKAKEKYEALIEEQRKSLSQCDDSLRKAAADVRKVQGRLTKTEFA